jgi:hypothetical protein
MTAKGDGRGTGGGRAGVLRGMVGGVGGGERMDKKSSWFESAVSGGPTRASPSDPLETGESGRDVRPAQPRKDANPSGEEST